MQSSETIPEQEITRKEVIQLLSQTFHHMVKSGPQYGYVTLGEAVFLLRTRTYDPGTLWYYYMDPNERSGDGFDVRWTPASLLSTLALMTLDNGVWTQIAENQLCRWPQLHPDLASRDVTARLGSCAEGNSGERQS